MKKPPKVKVDPTIIGRLWLSVFCVLFCITLAILVLGELHNWSGRRLVTAGTIVLTWFSFMRLQESLYRWSKKPLLIGCVVIGLALIMNVLLHLINVYSLDRNTAIQTFCQANPDICSITVRSFFLLKVYRFITLTITFFLSGLALFGGLLLISTHSAQIKTFKTKYTTERFLMIIGFAFLTLFLWQVMAVADQAFVMGIKSWQNRHLAFLDRFVPYEYGIEHHGWIWEYGKFIRAKVTIPATIFIPPQSDIWPQEGNKYYFRWFVYPINLVQSTDPEASIPAGAEYVLISRGGWNGGAAGWPKKPLLTTCIAEAHLIHRRTLVQRSVTPLELSQTLNPEEWGVIKLQGEGIETCL